MKKRGSHVGMILSFVIFVTFIVFLYLILQPTQKDKEKQNLLTHVSDELVKQLSAETYIITISNSSSLEAGCSQLDQTKAKISNVNSIKHVAKDEDTNILDSYIEANFLKISNPLKKQILWITYINLTKNTQNENLNLVGCGEMEPGLVKEDSFIIEDEIFLMKDKIKTEDEYNSLKTKFNLPSDMNFDFSFNFTNGSLLDYSKNEKNNNLQVYAKELPVQYLDTKASLKLGFINIKIW